MAAKVTRLLAVCLVFCLLSAACTDDGGYPPAEESDATRSETTSTDTSRADQNVELRDPITARSATSELAVESVAVITADNVDALPGEVIASFGEVDSLETGELLESTGDIKAVLLEQIDLPTPVPLADELYLGRPAENVPSEVDRLWRLRILTNNTGRVGGLYEAICINGSEFVRVGFGPDAPVLIFDEQDLSEPISVTTGWGECVAETNVVLVPN